MKRIHFSKPPSALRSPKVRLDYLALVPASMLPYKRQWQAIANGLAKDGVLIILPATERRCRGMFQTVASLLEAKGRRVTTIPAEQFAQI